MSARIPITLTLALFLSLQLLINGAQADADATRPNILFIYTDDQSHDAMSVVQKEMGAKGRYADCPFVVDGKDTKTKGRVDDVATDYAIEFINNLYNDPSAASLRENLQSEHDRLAAEIGYRVPDFVDRPTNWGKPGSPAGDPANP